MLESWSARSLCHGRLAQAHQSLQYCSDAMASSSTSKTVFGLLWCFPERPGTYLSLVGDVYWMTGNMAEWRRALGRRGHIDNVYAFLLCCESFVLPTTISSWHSIAFSIVPYEDWKLTFQCRYFWGLLSIDSVWVVKKLRTCTLRVSVFRMGTTPTFSQVPQRKQLHG